MEKTLRQQNIQTGQSILLLNRITMGIWGKSTSGKIENFQSVSEKSTSKAWRKVLGFQIKLAQGTKEPMGFQLEH